MKKIISALAAVLLAASLVSCGKTNDVPQENRYICSKSNVYNNGLIYRTLNTQFESAAAKFMSFDTMESAPLCAMPNCTHKSWDCASSILSGGTPVAYGDYFYYFTSDSGVKETGNGKREFYMDSKLKRMSMNTSEIEEIAHFTDCVPYTEDSFYLYGNTLYFMATDMNFREDEYGNIGTSSHGGKQFLCSIDIASGDYKNYGVVYDGDTEYEAADHTRSGVIIGEYNGKICISYGFLKDEITAEDRENASETGEDLRYRFTRIGIEFDPVTHEFSESELPAPSFADGDTYVCCDRETLKTILMYKGERYDLDCNTAYVSSVVNDKLFAPESGKWYDLTDMSEHSLAGYEEYDVIAYYNGSYILNGGRDRIKLTEAELLAIGEH